VIDVEPLIISELERMLPLPDRRRADWADVLGRAGLAGSGRSFPRRRAAVAVIAAVALAIPALALSGVLGSLFGFTNQGAPVSPDDLSRVSAVLSLTGATPGSVVQLASRDGWAFYGARTPNGDVCYFDAPAGQSESDGIPNAGAAGGCKAAAGEADFPSPARPVFNMSHYFGVPPDMSIVTLAGVAADGVASVEVLALGDCHVVATAPVTDNVYLADDLPPVPEAEVVALGADGTPVWHQAVDAAVEPAPNETSCGLG
jgi:hypothetical protein